MGETLETVAGLLALATIVGGSYGLLLAVTA